MLDESVLLPPKVAFATQYLSECLTKSFITQGVTKRVQRRVDVAKPVG